ncbi:histidine phosphatase family protein [Patescibacteria group bacterium]
MEEKLKNPCTIYLVRHGETDWNKKGILQGHKNPKLNPTGIQQAQKVAKRLKNIKFDAAYSSDLSRAKQTAEIIVLEHELAVVTRKAIREQSMGKYEGVKRSIFRKELKDLLEKIQAMSDEERFKFKRPHGIESHEKVVERFIRFLREIAVAHPNKTILVVSHGGLMKFFLRHLGFADYKKLDHAPIGNLSYIKILSDGIEFEVIKTHGVNLNEN